MMRTFDVKKLGVSRGGEAPLLIRLKSTRPSHGRVLPKLYPPEAKQSFLLPGLCTREIKLRQKPISCQGMSAGPCS